jgi:hypothetical protein
MRGIRSGGLKPFCMITRRKVKEGIRRKFIRDKRNEIDLNKEYR